MLCEYCNIKPATVIIKQDVGGEIKTIHVCKDCAAAIGVTFEENADSSDTMDEMDSFFASMFSNKKKTASSGATLTCDFCGMTLRELQKTGKVGCANCYTVFADTMDDAIRHIHASNKHHGKVPSRVDGVMSITRKIEALKSKLNVAVQNEEYEEAARLRDEIKALSEKGEHENEQKLV